MFIKLLKDADDETWDMYFVFEKDSPADDVLAKYEASLQQPLPYQSGRQVVTQQSKLCTAGSCTHMQCCNTYQDAFHY